MSVGFTCRGCGNFFFQAPKCVGCGAQKLYDSTVKGQWREIESQAACIAKLEAALHKIADRTKRAHPQAQEGEIHHIAINALTNNIQENING